MFHVNEYLNGKSREEDAFNELQSWASWILAFTAKFKSVVMYTTEFSVFSKFAKGFCKDLWAVAGNASGRWELYKSIK